MPAFLTFRDLIEHRFRSKRKGFGTHWYPMTCRTAEKFLRSKGIDIKAPRPGYEVVVKTERGERTILTNRGGKCEFTFYLGYREPDGSLPLRGVSTKRRR